MNKSIFFLPFIILNIYFVYADSINVPSSATVVGCGDGICSSEEDCNSCNADCGECFVPSGSVGGGGDSGGGRFREEIPIEPKEEEKEEIVKCEEYWICDEWEECEEQEQSRACYDLSSCNTTIFEPELKRGCGVVYLEPPIEEKRFNYFFFIIIILLLIIAYLLVKDKKHRKKK